MLKFHTIRLYCLLTVQLIFALKIHANDSESREIRKDTSFDERIPDKSDPVTLNLRECSYEEILDHIEKQTGYRFSFRSDLFGTYPATRIWVKDESVKDVLNRLFAPLSIEYRFNRNMIILRKKKDAITISGYVRETESGKGLLGASVYEVFSKYGTATNSDGYFNISIRPGTISLECSFIGYSASNLLFSDLKNDTSIVISLRPDTLSIKEVVISGSETTHNNHINSSQGNRMSFSRRTIKQTPVLFGEADIVKTLQLTPGVAAGTEGIAGLYVRGGNLDENLFLLDGNPVYQMNHIGGIFSAFNPEAVSNMVFFKGGFPARYGGRLSSVVDIRTNSGDMQKYHGSVSIGLIAGNISFEGPLKKDKTAFHISLRRTWLDAFSAPTLAIINKKNKKKGKEWIGDYAFHDINAKITHRFNNRTNGFISVYNGDDKMKAGNSRFSVNPDHVFREETHSEMRWGNTLVTAGISHSFTPRLYGQAFAVYSRYHSRLDYKQYYSSGQKNTDEYINEQNNHQTGNGIQDMGIRARFDFLPGKKHHIRFGADLLYHLFKPEYSNFRVLNNNNQQNEGHQYLTTDRLNAFEPIFFLEDDWDITETVRLNAGIRLSAFNTQKKTFFNPEPRVSVRWKLHDAVSIKGAYARMAQYVHQLSNSYMNLPTDSWMPVTASLKPLVSDQLSAGIYYQINADYSFSAEGYYKHLDNLLDYRDGYSFLPGNTGWEDKLSSGKGKAYGMEWMLRKEKGNTSGWIGYTLSWSDRVFADINEGNPFPSRYDNRHKINIVVTQKMSLRSELTAAWSYNTGNRTTLPLEQYISANPGGNPEYIELIPERNNFQLPAYHRLDLSLNIYKPKSKNRMGIWNVSVYNVYNRHNPFMITRSKKTFHSFSVPKFKTVSMLPVLPSISYTYKF